MTLTFTNSTNKFCFLYHHHHRVYANACIIFAYVVTCKYLKTLTYRIEIILASFV